MCHLGLFSLLAITAKGLHSPTSSRIQQVSIVVHLQRNSLHFQARVSRLAGRSVLMMMTAHQRRSAGWFNSGLGKHECLVTVGLFFRFSISSSVRTSLFNHVIRHCQCIKSFSIQATHDLHMTQANSTSTIFNTFCPIRWTIRALCL